jgi:hypothetical protein
VQEAFEGTLIAHKELLSGDLTTNELLHVALATPECDTCITSLTEWRGGTCQRLRWERCGAFGDTSAMQIVFFWAIGQVAKPRTSGGHDTSNLLLHLRISLLVVGAIIPMDESMKVRQVTNIKALPLDLPSHEERHLVMAAQL